MAYVKARDWDLFEIYEDKATGTNKNRPMLKGLMADARTRKFDIIICWKLDRFARSLKDLITMLQELTELGVDFVSLKDQIDLTTAAGRLMLHIIGAFGEFEASLIRERVRAGIQNARAKGRKIGRPKRRDDARIKTLRMQGYSLRAIAASVQTSLGAVQRALRAAQANQTTI